VVELAHGNILECDVEALVNTVNCVGVMGKGIALQFKQAFPDNYEAYRRACKAGELEPGRVFLFETGLSKNPKLIVNFPTKGHWRSRSRLEDVSAGLEDLVRVIGERGIRSIAIPPLGCGYGGLKWMDVRPLIDEALGPLEDVRVVVFEPAGSPPVDRRPVRTERPHLTLARAFYLKLMDQYGALDYRRTLLEVQKLAYFLQEAGQPLRLRFVAGHYGPYADNLNHVLQRFEGHFTRGFEGSRKPDTQIDLLDGAAEEADEFLSAHAPPEARECLRRVAELIEGFETPYGMELLATAHWVGIKEEPPTAEVAVVVDRVRAWSARKERVFQPHHIRVAWTRLLERAWING